MNALYHQQLAVKNHTIDLCMDRTTLVVKPQEGLSALLRGAVEAAN